MQVGSHRPVINIELGRAGKKFPLERAQEAIEESQKEARGGKVLLEG